MDYLNFDNGGLASNGEDQGMLFQDMFQQYLAPEVAKSAPSQTPIASTSELPFSSDAADDLSFSNATFDPTTYLPTIPGSPIGAFSPSSDNSGQRFNSMSPLSFPDLDGPSVADSSAWSFNPAVFATSNDHTIDDPTTSTSLFDLTTEPAAVETVSVAQVAPITETLPAVIAMNEQPDTEVSTSPVMTTRGTRSSAKQAKRQLSVSIKEEEDEDEDLELDQDESEDDQEGDSDDSSATHNTRATKKSRTSSSGSKARNAKTAARTSVAVFATKELHHTNTRSNLPPVPEWTDKPDPETYKKLSSKEKRQLRNKISARNFRHRRKEQLTSLEDEISSRDTIITQLREEVGTMRTENTQLRSEVSMLKEKWNEMMEKMTAFQVPQSTANATASTGLGVNPRRAVASSSSSSSSSSHTTTTSADEDEPWALDSPRSGPSPLPQPGSRRGTRASNGIAKPNMSKDVAPNNFNSRRSASRWTTQGFGGGYTSVHTTLLPDLSTSSLNPKPTLPAMFQQQNFNPALNNVSARDLAQATAHLRGNASFASSASQSSEAPAKANTFEDFFGSNPYWLRPDQVEEYRGALYGKLANNTAGLMAAQKLAQSSSSPTASLPLPTGFRPAFFTSSPSSRFAAPFISSGKEPRDVAASSDLLDYQSPRTAMAQQQDTTAFIATLATQTLFSKMTSAFIDAFAGNDSNNKTMDPTKVADVLSGRAKIQIVSQGTGSTPSSPSVSSLGLQLDSLALNDASSRPNSPSPRSATCSWDELRKKWCN